MKHNSARTEVQLHLDALPPLPMSRRMTLSGQPCLSVVERVLLSERDGLTIHALLGRTPDGWVAGWLVIGHRLRIKVQPAIRPRNKPQAERDVALGLALKGALRDLKSTSLELDWRLASLLKRVTPSKPSLARPSPA